MVVIMADHNQLPSYIQPILSLMSFLHFNLNNYINSII